MHRPFRSALVALLALVLISAAPAYADEPGSRRTLPSASDKARAFTQDQALDLLAKAKRQLRPDTRRIRARKPVGNGPSTDITMTLRDLYLARSVLGGLDRREADALLARPTDPGGDDLDDAGTVAYPTLGRASWCPVNGVACIHWVTIGAEKINTTDADLDGVPDYVEAVYATVADEFPRAGARSLDLKGIEKPVRAYALPA